MNTLGPHRAIRSHAAGNAGHRSRVALVPSLREHFGREGWSVQQAKYIAFLCLKVI